MWVIELSFTPGDEQRLAARPAHREVLARLHEQGVVKAAGPFADETGAYIVLDVPDRAAADAVVAADPYYRASGVTVASLREWTTVISSF
ncbi:YciI family protein [Actinoplanes sp. NPDC051470]|uniref:YciI family protein n=1 Tax=unclassified Actinoplanes TaxID=2626549 RepID=UPI00342A8F99